jgi:anti-sigma28 factor (negative regulator of flagellin synthesis)
LTPSAARSGAGVRTVIRYEAGQSVLSARIQALRQAFEATGVVFVDTGRLAGGVIPPRSELGGRGRRSLEQ